MDQLLLSKELPNKPTLHCITMPPNLVNVPPELHLSIFGFLEDLDDALYLSQTCRTLRSSFAHSKKIIEKQIIVRSLNLLTVNIWLINMQVTSQVYQYDLCLSKLNEMKEDLAQIYRTSGNKIPTDRRPKGKALLRCLNSKWGHETLTEKTIHDIAMRWQDLKYLRDLYLDDLLSKEFDLFRARFTSENLLRDTSATIVEPGFVKLSSAMSRIENSRGFDRNFKARFHQSLCLHSIAIISRSIAVASGDQGVSSDNPEPDEDFNEDVAQDIVHTVAGLWVKASVGIGGKQTISSLETQIDCLEVFDFLYLFLIRKLLPLEQLGSWTERNVNDWPYALSGPEIKMESWYFFILHAGFSLQPADLAHLIRERAWSPSGNYPQDKSIYMRVRGMFDSGNAGVIDWYSDFDRISMVGALQSGRQMAPPTNEHLPCWWDQVRLRSGRPFQAGFQSRYLSKLRNYELAAPKGVAS